MQGQIINYVTQLGFVVFGITLSHKAQVINLNKHYGWGGGKKIDKIVLHNFRTPPSIRTIVKASLLMSNPPTHTYWLHVDFCKCYTARPQATGYWTNLKYPVKVPQLHPVIFLLNLFNWVYCHFVWNTMASFIQNASKIHWWNLIFTLVSSL